MSERIKTPEAAKDPHEVLSWHWHPESMPSTHIHTSVREFEPDGHKLHVPSGRVSFEDVLRFAMDELDVLPSRQYRDTALARLEANNRRHVIHRRWSGSSPTISN